MSVYLTITGISRDIMFAHRALFNSSPANQVFQDNKAAAGTTEESLFAFAKELGAPVAAGKTPAQLVDHLAGNMLPTGTTLPNDVRDELIALVTEYGVEYAGIYAIQLGRALANLINDSTWGPAAQAWVGEVNTAFQYSSNSANTAPHSGDTPVGQGGQTFTLTENVETITGNDSDNTFLAYSKLVPAIGQMQTLQSGDQVDGKGGTDTLKADLMGAGVTTVPTLTSVEKLELSDYGGNTLNLSSSTGVQSVQYNLLVGNTTLDSVGNIVDLKVNNVTGDKSIIINYLAQALSGTETQKVSLSGDINNLILMGPGNLETVEFDVAAGGANIDVLAGTAVDNGMTKVVIKGAGALAADDDGEVDLTGTNTNTTLATVDASANEGGVKLNVGVALNQNVLGGKGNDQFNFGATLTKDDSVDGGDGDDLLIATGNLNATSYGNIKNIETVRMVMNGGDTGAINTLNAGAFSGIKGVEVQIQAGLTTNNNNDDAQIDNLAAGVTVTIRDYTDAEATKAGDDSAMDDVTINGANVTGGSDVLDVTLNAQRAGTDLTINDLIAQGYETINLTSTGKTPANADIENVITNGITNAALKTLNIKGDRELILGNVGAATTAATTIDASAMTGGGFSVRLGAANQKVTGSGFNDTITIAYGNLTKDDTIAGGDGTDTLVLNGGAMSFAGTANSEKLKNVSGFEKIGMDTANDTLILDDISMGAFTNNTVSIAITADVNGTGVDVSAVKSSNAKISVDTTKIVTAAKTFTFDISNGTDKLTGGAGIDIVRVSDAIYLSSSDELKGGAGNNNVFVFHDTDGAAETNTFAASQFTGVSGFSTWYFTDDTAADTFDITLSDAVAAANASTATGTLTVDMNNGAGTDNNDDTLKLDASAVGAATRFDVTGGDKADTIKLGAGDDTVNGGKGTDTISLGGGKNVVVLTDETDGATNSGIQHDIDTISGFNFGNAAGKADANIDKLDLKALDDTTDLVGNSGAFGWDAGFDAVQIVTAAGNTLADTDVLILTHQAFTDAAAVDTYLEANNGGNVDGDLIVIYQDTLGNVRVAFADGDNNATENTNADYTVVDLVSLTGITIAGVKDIIDVGDFIVA